MVPAAFRVAPEFDRVIRLTVGAEGEIHNVVARAVDVADFKGLCVACL